MPNLTVGFLMVFFCFTSCFARVDPIISECMTYVSCITSTVYTGAANNEAESLAICEPYMNSVMMNYDDTYSLVYVGMEMGNSLQDYPEELTDVAEYIYTLCEEYWPDKTQLNSPSATEYMHDISKFQTTFPQVSLMMEIYTCPDGGRTGPPGDDLGWGPEVTGCYIDTFSDERGSGIYEANPSLYQYGCYYTE